MFPDERDLAALQRFEEVDRVKRILRVESRIFPEMWVAGWVCLKPKGPTWSGFLAVCSDGSNVPQLPRALRPCLFATPGPTI
jgi:hypothetical protein